MLTEDLILTEKHGAVTLVRLNRPEKLNALNEALRQTLMNTLDSLAADPAVRAAVICGNGQKAFVAGADIEEFGSRSPAEQREVYYRRRLHDAVARFEKPLIAAIHGHCIGGGCELALACDIRVADRTARFSQAEIRLGLIPGAGATQRLTRLVGIGHALRLVLSGDTIDAEEALRIGLVEMLVDEGSHVEKALELAGRIVRWSPTALSLAKRAVQQALELPLSAGLAYEKELFLAAFGSEDGREGVRAFLEKRTAHFHGR